MRDYSRIGSVDEIRCSLGHIDPATRAKCLTNIEEMTKSIESEENSNNRKSVITMLDAKRKYLNKRLLLLPNASKDGKVCTYHS